MTNISNFHLFLNHASLDEKPYQVKGVEWCLRNEINGHIINGKKYHGGLMADEMGLGKTIQMLGVVLCNLKNRTLIVMPRPLIEQWKNIINKMVGHRVLVYHGEGKNVEQEILEKAPIVITTYGMIRKNKHKSLCVLHKMQWGRVIFDEAHHLRNKNTSNHKGALELQTDIRWLVTGTPIQNRISDFYALCEIIGLPKDYYTNSENLLPLARDVYDKKNKKRGWVEFTKP